MLVDELVATEMRTIEYSRQCNFIYRALWSTADVEHFIFFSQDSNGYFGASFALRNQFAEEFGVDAMIKYGHPNRQIIRQYRDPQTACSMSFEFGRIDRYTRKVWPRIRLQNVTGLDLATFVTGFIDRNIFPIVRHINDLNSLLIFLVSNEEPTPWFASGPSARAAQIVALATRMGVERNRIRSFLEPYERLIAIDLIGAKVNPQHPIDGYLDNYVDQLMSDLSE